MSNRIFATATRPATSPIQRLALWVTPAQRRALLQFARGEEGQWFLERAEYVANTITHMSGTYDQDGMGDQATAFLHYFTPGADFWILEKDTGAASDQPEDYQAQAFGLVRLAGGEPELGYISLPEILRAGAELDLYFEPTRVRVIKDQCRGR